MSRTKNIPVDGRTAFVSGAASGIGRAVALRLAAHGCPLVIADRDEPGLAKTAELIAGPVLTRVLDVRERQGQMRWPPKWPNGRRRRSAWCSTTPASPPRRTSPRAPWRMTSG